MSKKLFAIFMVIIIASALFPVPSVRAETVPPPVESYTLEVTKTVIPEIHRAYQWSLQKWASQTSILVSPGQVIYVDYAITAQSTGYVDQYSAHGIITLHNTSPVTANGIAVSDVVTGDIPANVYCPSTSIDAGATMECTYEVALPDGTPRENTVTVTADLPVVGGTTSVPFSFIGVSPAELYKCVQVYDTLEGPLGEVCAGTTQVFTYTNSYSTLPGYDYLLTCGENKYFNTVWIKKPGTTDILAYSSWTFIANVPCVAGCTLTPGYWKTHSQLGPAPYDSTWLKVGSLQEQTPFFLSGKTWYQVFWTAPAGNPYYILAHAYMAAKINVLDGTSAPAEVLAAMTAAENLLGTYTPAQVMRLRVFPSCNGP